MATTKEIAAGLRSLANECAKVSSADDAKAFYAKVTTYLTTHVEGHGVTVFQDRFRRLTEEGVWSFKRKVAEILRDVAASLESRAKIIEGDRVAQKVKHHQELLDALAPKVAALSSDITAATNAIADKADKSELDALRTEINAIADKLSSFAAAHPTAPGAGV